MSAPTKKTIESFDAEPILATLKDFQRRTVEHVYERMYGPGGVDRFLVADEVGLGKTLVAKGIIAKAVKAIGEKTRVDVVYLCANQDIATQNIDRLNVFDEDRVSGANRLTLLPLHMKQLQDGPNFIALTPKTALDLGWATGVKQERTLLYWMVREAWGIEGAELKNFLQVGVNNDNWDRAIREMRTQLADLDGGGIDAGVRNRFKEEISKVANLRQRLEAEAKNFERRREKPSNVPHEHRGPRDEVIGELRECLARACLAALEPDIIILDEFQRFKSLLTTDETEGDKELAAQVADLGRKFLAYEGVKILLLSATPYKPYTTATDGATEDHYKDFLKTAGFLLNDRTAFDRLKGSLTAFNEALFDTGPQRRERLQGARRDLEQRLRQHMVRTERLAVSATRDGMIEEVPLPECRLGGSELQAFATIDAIARQLEQPDVLEYWKSAPYLLNFMERDGYVIKTAFLKHLKEGKKLRVEARAFRQASFSAETMARFGAIDPQNSRLRALIGELLDRGAWKILWLPPTVPYYRVPGNAYQEAFDRSLTKVLVFSDWRFVPRAVAAMLSYEAERRVVELAGGQDRYDGLSTRARKGRLRFSLDAMGQPRDLNHLIPLYPSPVLCELIDPLEEARHQTPPLDQEALLELCTQRVRALLGTLPGSQESSGGQDDQGWYLGAPSQADRKKHGEDIAAWLEDKEDVPWWTFKGEDEDDTTSAFRAHVQALIRLSKGPRLGRRPADLERVLAKAALGSPAVVALRSLRRLARAQGFKGYPNWLLECAAQVGAAFRTLFNQPDAMVLTQAQYGRDDDRYWEAMLDHCIAGNLQAVMDEHVHILREAEGVATKPPKDAIDKIADALISALSLRATILRVDDLRADPEVRLMEKPLSIRCRSALRFDNDPGEAEGSETRAEQVRKSFNSPFRPFVMATTKVGQEGLDFHLWCHSVFHWHLPPNPVDFEQREGRVHRYKGHVIRKSVASELAAAALQSVPIGADLWEHLFSLAREGRDKSANDLVPYWIFKGDGTHKIRRYVPALPLSRERAAAARLRASLGVYRLVFGQARQEDLLAFLRSTRSAEELDSSLYAVNLAPQGN